MQGRTMVAGWLAVVLAGTCAWGAQVENVRAQQRARSRVVDVWYDLVAPEGGVYEVSLAIGGEEELPISSVGGDWGADIEPGRNKRIEWDAGADWAGHVGSNFVATVTATRIEEDTGPSKGMVRIPGGTNSGNDPDDGWYSLTVGSFYMDKTEVTYAHWKRVYNWAVAHGYQFDNPGSGKGANHPVHTVNWYDCVKWCNARSEMEGRTPAYTVSGEVYRTGRNSNPSVNWDGAGYRFPTATEWEYAARGGLHGRRFPWGDTISHAKANYNGYSSNYNYDLSSGYNPRYTDTWPYSCTAPVASFAANRYGLCDMAGNVTEWTHTASGSMLNLRGGGWTDYGYKCRCDFATWINVANGNHAIGFRTVRRR